MGRCAAVWPRVITNHGLDRRIAERTVLEADVKARQQVRNEAGARMQEGAGA